MLSSRIPRAATYLRFGFTNLCGDRNSRCDFRFFSPGYRIVLYAGHIRRNRMLGHSNVRNVGRGDRSVCGHRFFALPLHPCKEKPCFSGKFREIKLYRIMYWTLELASEKKIGICLDKIHYLYRGSLVLPQPLFFNFKHLQYGTTETTISIGTLSPAYPG